MNKRINKKKKKNNHRSRRSSRITGPNVRSSSKRTFSISINRVVVRNSLTFVHIHPSYSGEFIRFFLINRTNDEIELRTNERIDDGDHRKLVPTIVDVPPEAEAVSPLPCQISVASGSTLLEKGSGESSCDRFCYDERTTCNVINNIVTMFWYFDKISRTIYHILFIQALSNECCECTHCAEYPQS